MSNDTREALAAKCKKLAERYADGPHDGGYYGAWRTALYDAIDELAALTEQPAAPQQAAELIGEAIEWETLDGLCRTTDRAKAMNWEPNVGVRVVRRAAPRVLGDSLERCGSPSGAASGGSASRVPHGWVSVTERLPEPDSGEVLVWLTGGRCAFDEWHMHREDPTGMSTTYTMEMGLMWRDYDFEEITHWMPLPKPPVAMGHVGQEPSLEASVAGPEARPDQQSDSCAAPQAEPPPGFVLVPKEPTEEMQCAGWNAYLGDVKGGLGRFAITYRAMLAAAPAAPAQEPQRPDVPVKQATVLMKLIRAAWKGDPGIAEAYGNLLAERMDADGFTGRYVRDTLAILRGERQEVLIHPAAASSPAPAVQPLTMGRIYEVWHEIGADVAGLSWAKFAEALQHGQPQGGSNG